MFLSSNTGLLPGAPNISSLQVSVTAYSNVSLKCEEGVRPSDCYDNSLQWYFNNSSGELKSGEKYDIQERKTNTRCKTDFILLLTLLMQTKESINVSGSARMTTPAFPGLQLSSWKYILQKKVLILLWYLKVLCHEIYQSSESGKRNQIGWNIKITAQTPPPGGGGGGLHG